MSTPHRPDDLPRREPGNPYDAVPPAPDPAPRTEHTPVDWSLGNTVIVTVLCTGVALVVLLLLFPPAAS